MFRIVRSSVNPSRISVWRLVTVEAPKAFYSTFKQEMTLPIYKYVDVSLTARFMSPKLILSEQVGINLTDPTFRGEYYGKRAHEDDTEFVLQRAIEVGCIKFMVTGSDLEESKKAILLAEKHPGRCYATVGVHPCSAKTFESHPGGPSQLLRELEDLATDAKRRGVATAFGEIGLDYDRLMLTGKEQQLTYFEAQLDVAVKVQLPLFLHSRAAGEDFESLLSAKLPRLPRRGLVHSFTGTVEEMERLVALGLDIGVNGCSMKTEENLEVVKRIPLEHLQIETDGPWVRALYTLCSPKFRALDLLIKLVLSLAEVAD